jgi:hypothetical protein
VSLVLDLLPCGHIDATHGHSHEIIRVTDFFDGPELYEKICALPMVPVPPRFMTYLGGPNDDGNPSYGNTQTDAYGAQVMVTTMGYLKKLAEGTIISTMSQEDVDDTARLIHEAQQPDPPHEPIDEKRIG